MPRNDEIEKDQYDKINSLTAEVKELAGAVSVSNAINADLVKVVKMVLRGALLIIIILILALVYLSTGPEGYKAIRETIPTIQGGGFGGGGGIPSSDDSAMVSPICPPPDPRILVATAA